MNGLIWSLLMTWATTPGPMERFFEEIRQRGVLRAAGLYIALVWLVLQIADVVFPAFEIPDSVVRYILYASVLLFPAVLLFSWFYEVTASGLVKEDSEGVSSVERKDLNRKMAALTISVLAAALAVSVVLNVQKISEVEVPAAPPANVSLLIADTVNNTGEAIFDGVLEQALNIGLEGASFINSAPRHLAVGIADENQMPGSGLDLERASLVALREGVQLVLVGDVGAGDDGYTLGIRVVDPASGETAFTASAEAADKTAVLQAVASLTEEVRGYLGESSMTGDPELGSFSANSLEAVSYYTRAQELARDGKDAYAVPLYQKAVQADPGFGRAYSGWALSEFNLGHEEKSAELWDKTLSMLESMNDRERYRTLGLYYMLVTNNLVKAIENYELLVEEFPADGIAHNNLAVAYFLSRDFAAALEEGSRALEVYPNHAVLRSNNALYAMYLGDFEMADRAADRAIEVDASFHKPYLAKAIAALSRRDFEAAEANYELMARQGGDTAESLATSGRADMALLRGQPEDAARILKRGIRFDTRSGNERGAQRKQLTYAQALAWAGEEAAAREQLAALEASDSPALLVPLGRLLVSVGDLDEARLVREQLGNSLLPGNRAAGDLLEGNILLAQGQFGPAIDALNASIDREDSWLARFDRGRAYALAGSYAEALSEFELCLERLGEASSIFLDDQPTFHYSAELYYWLGMARAELGNLNSSREALEIFLALQGRLDSPLVADARRRLADMPAAAAS